MKEHRRSYNGDYKYGRLYGYIRNNGGWDEWTFEILETKECEMRRHRLTREGELIREHNASLNIVMPGNDVVDYEDDRTSHYALRGSSDTENTMANIWKDANKYPL